MNNYDRHLSVAELSAQLRRERRGKVSARRILLGVLAVIGFAALATLYVSAHAEYANGDSYRLTDKQVSQLYSGVTDSADIKVIRIREGKDTCYVAFTDGNGSVPYGTSVSCFSK